jgi:hypothetical protein
MLRILATLGFLGALAAAPAFASPFEVRVVSLFCFWGALALAWNILGGFAG